MKIQLRFSIVALFLAIVTFSSAQSILDVNKVYVIKTVITAATNVTVGTYTYSYAVGDTVYWTANDLSKTYGAKSDGIYAVKQANFSSSNDASLWTIEYTSGVYRIRNKYNTTNKATLPYIQTWGANTRDLYMGAESTPSALTITATTSVGTPGKVCYNVKANQANDYFDQLLKDVGTNGWICTATTLTTTNGAVAGEIFIQEAPSPVATVPQKAALLAAITEKTAIYNGTSYPEGTALGQYTAANRATFLAAITAAQTVYNSSTTTVLQADVAVTSLANALITLSSSVNVETNLLADGAYYIKIKDASNNDLYLTDISRKLPASGATADDVWPTFAPKNITEPRSQIFVFTKDGTRYRIDSQVRLDSAILKYNVSADPRTYINEKGNFGFNAYSTAWNSMAVYSNGVNYAILSGGSATIVGAWVPNGNAVGSRNLPTTGLFYNNFIFSLASAAGVATGVAKENVSNLSLIIIDGGLVVSGMKSIGKLQVCDFSGKLIKDLSISNGENVKLNKGVYIIKIYTESTTKVEKVIVR